MIIYNSRGLRWGEIWFDEAPDPRDLRDIDLLFYHQRSSPIHPRRWQYYYTIPCGSFCFNRSAFG